MRQFILGLIIIISITACAVEVPEIYRYGLEANPITVSAQKPSNKTLFVSAPQASAEYKTTQIAYTTQLPKINYYTNHQWVATPTAMLQSVLLKTIHSARYFNAVVTPPTTVHSDLQLDVQLLQFYLELSPKQRQQSRFKLQLKTDLIDSKNNAIIFSKTLNCQQPLSQVSPYHAAAAANVAVNRCMRKLLQSLSDLVNSA